MATPSLPPFPTPFRRQLDASKVERIAQLLAVADGLLAGDDPLTRLHPLEASGYRARARVALSGRDWRDAELFAREQHAQEISGGSFAALSRADQGRVMHRAANFASAIRLYMQGDAAELNATTRAWAMTEEETVYEAGKRGYLQ